MKRNALLFLLFLACSGTVLAQRYEVGLKLGTSLYVGDLVPGEIPTYLKTLHPAAGLYARLNGGEYLSLRLSYNYLTVSGDDANKSQANNRGIMFRSRVHELNVVGEVNIFRLNLGVESYLSPYLLAGGGLFWFNPKAEYDPLYARDGGQPSRPELLGQWIDLQPLGTEGQGIDGFADPYELMRPNVLLGGGLKYRVAYQWLIGIEAIGRLTFFDYLDDVSDVDLNYGQILREQGALAAEMSFPKLDPTNDSNLNREYFRGGGADDYYVSVSLTVGYLFGGDESGLFGSGRGRIKCPTF